MGTINPIPILTPQSATDPQVLVLIHQIQNHLLNPLQAALLGYLLSFPLPLSLQTKLHIYYFLSPVLGSIHVSPTIAFLVIFGWPLWILAFFFGCYYIFKHGLRIFGIIAPTIFGKYFPPESKVFLEVTFPSDTSKSAYATSQLYTLLHTLSRRQTFSQRLLSQKKTYSLEIVSAKEQGIRYLLGTNAKDADIFKTSLLSYLPGVKVKEAKDYLPSTPENLEGIYGIAELKLSRHFALPLNKQKTLSEHDPISYLTGNMTKLFPGEVISFQIVTIPILSTIHDSPLKEMQDLRYRIYKGLPLTPILNKSPLDKFLSLPLVGLLWFLTKMSLKLLQYVIFFVMDIALSSADHGKSQQATMMADAVRSVKPQEILNPYEQELSTLVKEKIDQHLFETSIRLLVATRDDIEYDKRINGLLASFGQMSSSYQAIGTKGSLISYKLPQRRFKQFKTRSLSFTDNPILSISELSDLYHFPYSQTTKTEDMVKLHSKELPAPLSIKNSNLDVIFGENTYGGETTYIGLTEEERLTHMYILGRTGSGKTTLMFSMAKHDIENERGLAFIDPHGDVAEDLLASIPLSRKDDLIYVNPIDLKHPIGINLLELTPGLDEDDVELEKEVVAEGVISLFRKVFSKEENVNAHRIEYILRNTIYTAFTVKGCTIFTISKILTNPNFRRQVTSKLKDPDLIDFWKYEFGKAGDFQVVKMTQGVTAKVGRFFRSPTAKRILEQEKSTINFNDIINQGKILICNFSQGKLGEDTSRLLGTTIMTKLQQAALKRAYIPEHKRKVFYLYVDEFQTFATQSFTKMVTEGRKYRMPLIIAEQSTSQQKDRDITNIILANVTTVISFRSGNYIDEELMLNQFSPYLEKGTIMNLPRYHFYIKISAIESEEPFSGTTILTSITKDPKKIEKLIEASRKNWAIVYKKPEVEEERETKEPEEKEVKTEPKSTTKNKPSGKLLPDEEEE